MIRLFHTPRAPLVNLATVVLFFLAGTAHGADESESPDALLAKQLGLTLLEDSGTRLYYDPECKGDPARALAAYAAFLRTEAKSPAEIAKHADAIINDINRLTGAGADDAAVQAQRKLLAGFGSMMRIKPSTPLVLAGMSKIKAHVQSGGTIPNFTFNKTTGKLNYNLQFNSRNGAPTTSPAMLVWPIVETNDERALDQAAEKFTDLLKKMSAEAGGGVALHEVVESAIVTRLKPFDPYFRWFSDGFANAITAHLLRTHIGKPTADAFLADFDAGKYADIEKDVNLYYWMALNYCIPIPDESEQRLTYARYAYATLEANRLIDKHGVESVRKILDRATTRPSNDSRELFPAIKDVTGEDMRDRLTKQYQTFSTREEGLNRYTARLDASAKDKDLPAALRHLMRVHELRAGIDVKDYPMAAAILAQSGKFEAADKVFEASFQLAKGPKEEKALRQLHRMYVELCVKYDRSAKVTALADELLKTEPDFLPALAARMINQGALGNMTEAKEIATKIQKLDPNPSSFYHRLTDRFTGQTSPTTRDAFRL